MSYAPPSLPVLGSERPPVAITTDRAVKAPRLVSTMKTPSCRRMSTTRWSATIVTPTRGGFAEQGVEHVARLIRVGEHLAAGLLVQGDAEIVEPVDRVSRRERTQDAADDRSASAPEVELVDRAVRDVAARPAADQDLCARLAGAVEQLNAKRRFGATGEDRRGEAGGAGARPR